MTWIITVGLVLLVLWAITRFHLSGEDLARYDVPMPQPVNDAASDGNQEVLAAVRALAGRAAAERSRDRLQRMREAMDQLGAQADLNGVTIAPVTVAGRPAEWLTGNAGDSRGRLLYLHGGAFTMGSPLSHRVVTAELVRRTGLAVLAVDYRLMPEYPRAAGIDDCRNAYRWMLDHGPDGDGPAVAAFVAGDSAGGNLTLALVAWIRDQVRWGAPGLRQVDGAIALSPLTDATLTSPSLRRNIDTDPLLGAMAQLILRFPRSLMLWWTWLQNRLPPTDPRLSPVRGDLSNLPPLLVQASEAEILIDDARRYANKARNAGSPVEIETWHGMVHVWQAFGPDLPETGQAFARIQAFVERVLASRGRADAA